MAGFHWNQSWILYFLSILSVTSARYNNISVLLFYGNQSTDVNTIFYENRTLIREIILEDDNVPVLKTTIFKGLHFLNTISIQRSNLVTLEENLLLGLMRLNTVNFNNNKIRHVPANIFKNNPVKAIFLKSNAIRTIGENAFYNLPNLHTLDLSYNDIELLPKNMFVHTTNVKYLNLRFNKLRHFPAVPYRPYSFFDVAFANATKEESTVLDLSNNNFTFISYYLLRGIRFMNDLRLDHNKVELISDYAFDDFKSVNNLNLESNNLQEIGDDLLEVLVAVDHLKVSNNPWKGEFICKFQDWCEKNDKLNYMNFRCPIETVP